MMPARLTSPRVGLSPTRPIAPDGHTIEPSVSVPIATWASAAATAAPEPLDEPHGLRSRTYGLLVCPPTPLHPDVAAAVAEVRPLGEVRLAEDHRASGPEPADELGVAAPGGNRAAPGSRPCRRRSAVSMLSFRSTGTPSSLLRGPCAFR